MRQLFAIKGLACGGCARGLERHLSRVEGVQRVGVHHLTASMLIDWDNEFLTVADLSARVSAVGYKLIERHQPAELSAMLADDIRRLSLRLAIAVMAGMWSMALAAVLYFAVLAQNTAWWIAATSGLLAVPVMLYSGAGVFWMAAQSLRLRVPNMDLLVGLGAGGAFIVSLTALAYGSFHVYFDTATMLITLLLVGRLLDCITRRNAIDALSALESRNKEYAVRRAYDQDQTVNCDLIAVGDMIVIDAGATVTVDGIVQQGQSQLNRAVLTGESRAISVNPGDRIEAGSINLQKRLIVRADRLYGDRDIDRMGGAIAIELAQRGSLATRADRIASWLGSGLPVLALITLLFGLSCGMTFSEAILRGLTVLAAACPCALSIAAPLAQARAAALAAQQGLRLREPHAFEALACVTTAVFDKTGTLTNGSPSVFAVNTVSGWKSKDVMTVAAAAETGIAHPLARAVIRYHGREEGSGGTRLERGATTLTDDGRRIEVHGLEGTDGCTTLSVTIDGHMIGSISLIDQVRPDAKNAWNQLKAQGIDCWIATGDERLPAENAARSLDCAVSKIRYNCSPADKVELVRSLPGPVMFVGDGVNDAPALAAADCGVSVASAHSAAAQTADLAIMEGGIDRLLNAISLARRSASITRYNIVFALVYNAIALPFALSGALVPSFAALAMLGSSLSVGLNSLLGFRSATAVSVGQCAQQHQLSEAPGS